MFVVRCFVCFVDANADPQSAYRLLLFFFGTVSKSILRCCEFGVLVGHFSAVFTLFFFSEWAFQEGFHSLQYRCYVSPRMTTATHARRDGVGIVHCIHTEQNISRYRHAGLPSV